jgi:hypothetical protein
MEHVSQALEYEALLKKHRSNIVFTTYIMGVSITIERYKRKMSLPQAEEVLQWIESREQTLNRLVAAMLMNNLIAARSDSSDGARASEWLMSSAQFSQKLVSGKNPRLGIGVYLLMRLRP